MGGRERGASVGWKNNFSREEFKYSTLGRVFKSSVKGDIIMDGESQFSHLSAIVFLHLVEIGSSSFEDELEEKFSKKDLRFSSFIRSLVRVDRNSEKFGRILNARPKNLSINRIDLVNFYSQIFFIPRCINSRLCFTNNYSYISFAKI